MRVVLAQKIVSLGNAGDVVEVSDGYARNFLLAKGYAKEATAQVLADLANKKQSAAAQSASEDAANKALAEKIGKTVVTLLVKAKPDKTLYGKVTPHQIEEQLYPDLREHIDTKLFVMSEPIDHIGRFGVVVQLGKHKAQLQVIVREKE